MDNGGHLRKVAELQGCKVAGGEVKRFLGNFFTLQLCHFLTLSLAVYQSENNNAYNTVKSRRDVFVGIGTLLA